MGLGLGGRGGKGLREGAAKAPYGRTIDFLTSRNVPNLTNNKNINQTTTGVRFKKISIFTRKH
jgi:hypothetical protein